jgi:hypothetical protein
MELSPSWEADSCAATQELPNILCNPRFITVFTRALHRFLSWARPIQSIPSHPILLRSILTIRSFEKSKSDGRGFESRWGHCISFLNISLLILFLLFIHFLVFWFYPTSLILKNKMGLMRSPCSLCLYVYLPNLFPVVCCVKRKYAVNSS